MVTVTWSCTWNTHWICSYNCLSGLEGTASPSLKKFHLILKILFSHISLYLQFLDTIVLSCIFSSDFSDTFCGSQSTLTLGPSELYLLSLWCAAILRFKAVALTQISLEWWADNSRLNHEPSEVTQVGQWCLCKQKKVSLPRWSITRLTFLLKTTEKLSQHPAEIFAYPCFQWHYSK